MGLERNKENEMPLGRHLNKNDVGKYFRTRNGSLAFVCNTIWGVSHPFKVRLLEYNGFGDPMWSWVTCTRGGFIVSERSPYIGDLVERVDTENALAELALMGVEPPRM